MESSRNVYSGQLKNAILQHTPIYRLQSHWNSSTLEYKIIVTENGKRKPISKLIFTVNARKWIHVKSVHVIEDYRGKGLGSILFIELFTLSSKLGISQIRLEAEEDIQRHGRLENFYKQLGFSVKEGSPILYLSNNDFEMYRKIPMFRSVHQVDHYYFHSLSENDFKIIRICSKRGDSVLSNPYGILKMNTENNGGSENHWILVQESVSYVCFESAKYGRFLCAEPDGKVVADRRWDDTWEHFYVELSNPPEEIEASLGSEDSNTNTFSLKNKVNSDDDWFALKTYHGQYLFFDEELSTISCTSEKVLWRTTGSNGICECEVLNKKSKNTSDRKQVHNDAFKEDTTFDLHLHLSNMRQRNTFQYVCKRLEHYKSRRHKYCSFWDVFLYLQNHWVEFVPGTTLSPTELLALTAHDLLDKAEPDWVALIGLLHGCGRILCFPEFFAFNKTDLVEQDDRESGIAEYSWVVGTPFPSFICCQGANVLNDDEHNSLYSSGTGAYTPHCGLDSCYMAWTGPEYMYQVLKNADTKIPAEGLAMIRYYPLEVWHLGGAYRSLTNEQDEKNIDFVRKFDTLRRATLHSVIFKRRSIYMKEMLEKLRPIVEKYIPNTLPW